MIPNREKIAELKTQFPNSTRVKLVKMKDACAPKICTLGTVHGVDDIGSLLLKWDNGSNLHVIYSVDLVEKVKPNRKEESEK